MATSMARRTSRTARAALGVVMAAALTAGCGAGTVTVGAAGAPAAAPQDDDPGVPAVRPPDPLAPADYRQVVRRGGPPHPDVRPVAGGAGLGHSVKYTDGMTVRLDDVAQGAEEGAGPGVYPGRPHTALTLTLVNLSAKPLDLDEVVVTALYGKPARIASPVYEDAAARDFSGTVAPGASATATYVFSVPVDAAASVVAIVDVDGVHVAARLSEGK